MSLAAAITLPVVGWFVSPIIGKVVEHVYLLQKEDHKLKKSVAEEIRRLDLALRLIVGVLQDAEDNQCNNLGVHAWLGELKRILYEAEDLLDLHATDIALEQREEEEEHVGSTPPGKSASVSHFAKSESSDLSVAKQVEDIRKKLDDICERGRKLGLREIATAQQPYPAQKADPVSRLWEKRETSSFLAEESAVVGRDEEKAAILKLLLPGAAAGPSSEGRLQVIAIVGMGGVGKTTLARLVFHDEAVKGFFKLRIWVCVGSSSELHRKQILVDIVNSCRGSSGRSDSSLSLDALQNSVVKEIGERQPFLLVLDDAWDSDRGMWKAVLEPLRACGRGGNRVIVTTRDTMVPDSIHDTSGTICVGFLDDDDMWRIFKRSAFRDGGPSGWQETIGKQIVRKLKGLPLAAEAIGSILRGKGNGYERYWRSILEKLLEAKQVENDVLQILMLSYTSLPSHLKCCFSYFSLFPKDHRFYSDGYHPYGYNRDHVVLHWMAHKFFQPGNGAELEENVGTDGFIELLNKTLLQMSTDTSSYFAMHDLIHDLAEMISKDEFFRVGDDPISEFPKDLRHVSFFQEKSISRMPGKLEGYKNLRSLLFSSMHNLNVYSSSLPGRWFENLRCLRVLCLHNDYISSLPDSIGNLRLLRILDLQLMRLAELPETMSNLYNLQVLKVHGCERLAALPNSITRLVNLRCLDIDDSQNLKLLGTINGIGKLTGLVQLRAFCVKKEEGYKITELKNLDRVCGSLCIVNLENIECKEDAEGARLDQKKGLEELHLHWNNEHGGRQSGVLQGLCPSNNLKKLFITGYGEKLLPSWLNVQSLPLLECISIWSCKNVTCFPFLSTLQQLSVSSCSTLVNIQMPRSYDLASSSSSSTSVSGTLSLWQSVSSIPSCYSLKNLHIDDCPHLDESLSTLLQVSTTLESVFISSYNHPLEKFSHLTLLSKLILQSCSKRLTLNLPNLILLKELEIIDCPGAVVEIFPANFKPHSSLQRFCVIKSPMLLESCGSGAALTSLTKLTIGSNNSLNGLMLSRFLSGLTALQMLEICYCPKITSIPDKEALCELVAVKQLEISNCEGIRELDLKAFPSLERLVINSCPNLMFDQTQSSPFQPIREIFIYSFISKQLEGLSSLLRHSPPQNMRLFFFTILNEGSLGLEQFNHAASFERLLIAESGEVPLKLPPFEFLRSLELSSCPNITSLPVLISLTELTIDYCSNLMFRSGASYPLFPSLESLSVSGFSLGQLTDLILEVSRSCLKKLRVDGCDELQSFEDELELPFLSLIYLEELELCRCSQLRYLPADLKGFEKLHQLNISTCPEILSLPDDGLPTSLQHLQIYQCPSLEARYLDKVGGQHLGLLSHIPYIRFENR